MRQRVFEKLVLKMAAAAMLTVLSGMSATQDAYAQSTRVQPAAKPAPHTGEYWTKHDQGLMVDFGDLERYKSADAALGAPAPGVKRVVFMGDSITDAWKLEGSFPGKPYVNRGISGETTPQMLVRFRQDVIDLDASAVVILAGTNDLAGNTGPMTLEQTEENLASMADLATANGIKVILCSILPAFDYPWSPGLEPAPKIATLNEWIRGYAARKGYIYVDYYSAMKDERGGLPAALSKDGVHPLPAGYALMAPLVEAGIEQALKN
ncbi:MAG TPA: SGNH/GDSL hydrolase family protein [Terracidiphilus sp.]|nr:SGNH/GDSL hydrolase family protein [Terracidiphilus sp.]